MAKSKRKKLPLPRFVVPKSMESRIFLDKKTKSKSRRALKKELQKSLD